MANPLQVSVKSSETAGSVDVRLTNTGTETVSVLLWDTPFEPTLSESVFLIEKASKDFPYLEVSKYSGRSVKRSVPTAENYRTLQAGESISARIKLNEHYDISEFGEYSVRFDGDIRYEVVNNLQGRSRNTFESVEALTHAELSTESVAVSLSPNLFPRLRPPIYDSCSVQEQQDIVQAGNIAESLTNTAISDLRGLTVGERIASPRYSTWFGSYTERRYNRVIDNLSAIGDALEDERLQFNCNCNESGVFAFVFPAFPYSITLCPSFRNARPNGEDSRAGTIIHELSHFNVVASTHDHVYGQSAARALATSDPDSAVENADSYEYFAENAPALPIRGAAEGSSLQTLRVGVLTRGTVDEGQEVTVQVTDTNRVELRSLSGDADLYVYRDEQLTSEICSSTSSTSPLDSCDFFETGTVYVQIRGFSDTSFTILANSALAVNDGETINLTLGVPVTDSVRLNSRVFYEVSGANIIELESLGGDADLYVYSGLDFTSDSLVCESNEVPQDSTTDRCNIPTTQSIYYVAVVGFTDADYTLLARSTVSANAVRLIPGQAIGGNLNEGSFDYYVVSGADSIVLTSVTGDADLRVTTDPEFLENETSCTSEQFSVDTRIDTCVLASGIEHYIRVRGFTDTTYSIMANVDTIEPTVPVSDDPVTQPVIVGSRSGGGAFGIYGLILLLSVVCFRAASKGKRA